MSFSSITNIYELLDEEGEEGVKKVVPTKTAAKPAPAKGSSSAPAKSSQQTTSSKPQSSGDNQRRGEGRGERRDNRGDRGEGRGNAPRGDRPPRQPRENYDRAPVATGFGIALPEDSANGSVEFARRPNGPREGSTRHDDNRRGNSSGYGNREKRTYDRKSGTGRGNSLGREDKKHGGGRGNWGRNDGSETLDEVEGGEAAAEGETPASTDDVHGAEKAEVVETEEQKARREEREREDKLITLEEYNRQREAKRQQSAVLSQATAVRKANEGVDDKTAKKWSSMEKVTRDDEKEEAKTKTPAEGQAVQRKENKKGTPLALNFTVKDSQPRAPAEDRDDRRGGRGGRGGRGRGGSEGSRGGRGGSQQRSQGERRQQQGPEVNFSDFSSFPTLQ